jgi:hypothetical protein
MKRIRPWIATYLILALGLAGVAGLVPWLHVWVEHGGEGVPHFHARSTPVWPLSRTELRRVGANASRIVLESRSPFANQHESFQLPLRPLANWLTALGRRLAGRSPATPDPKPNSDIPGHHHEGLIQLLGEGLIDHAPTADPPAFFASFGFAAPGSACDLPRTHAWDPQTAGRAPPEV